MSKIVLLINPLSATRYISEELKAKNFFSIALFTVAREKIPAYFQPALNLFDKQIYIETTDTQLLAKTVSSYDIDFILNGSDDSLLITEKIIEHLLPHYNNDQNSIVCRNDKFTMQETFKTHHLPYIKQLKITLDDQLALSKISDVIGFPCFIKPVLGAASIGASYCYTYQDLMEKLKIQLYTATHQLMDEYIVQEIIQGEEIFVDIFSVDGQHYVSSVQTITKEEINGTSCYRTETLIYDNTLWQKAVDIVKKALDACGFRNGFTHTELFYLKDGSFRIIEINPRISGAKGLPNSLAKYHGLQTQVDLLASYLDGEKIIESVPDAIQGYGEILYLYNFSQNPTQDIRPHLAPFQSIKEVIPASDIGTIPPKIKNLSNVDCMLLLYDAQNKAFVIKEAEKIGALEKSGLLFAN